MTTKRIAAVALAASAIIAQTPATAEGVQQDRGFKSSVIAAKKAKAVKAKKAKTKKAKVIKAKKTSKFAGHKGLNLDRKAPAIKAKAVKKKAVKAKAVKAKSFKAPIVKKKKIVKAKAFKAPVVKKKIVKASFNQGFKRNGFKAKTFKAGFGYSPIYVGKLKRQALHACSTQLRHDAYKFGYEGVKLTGADVKHIGKNKFVVHAGAKLYDGYSFSHEPYKCTVVHGKVIDAYKPKKLKF